MTKPTKRPSEDSDQLRHPSRLISFRCPPEEMLGPQLPIERTAKTLIRVLAGRTSHFVGFVMR